MTTCSVIGTPARFARCLANFQVDELLLLKRSVQRMVEEDEEDFYQEEEEPEEATKKCPEAESRSGSVSELPERMALMADRGGDHDSGTGPGPWHSHHSHAPAPAPSWTEQKPTKLQTLFQISITALAFLSFGGYLLCLIVQAIKSKGTTYFHPVATASTSSTNGNVKRIKIYRRSKRSSRVEGNHLVLLQQDYATYMRAMRGRMLT
ncbi:uncharacterized protein [Drosophila kikkawai]|uniref:CG14797-PA n=1 Tax=Drosophila kikkawai TaxID=30033 RepID=A0A6P4J3F8_DROKI|nr:uncharacterized protein LOC108079310 [Drosophila kikkawai]